MDSGFGIKYDTGESSKNDDKRLVWNSLKVDEILEALENGIELKHSPFFEGDINYKRGNLVFDYTDDERVEIKKCAKDIIHFANTHCQVMTDDGYMKIRLRDYQIDMLKSFQSNRWNICLAPRQVGKCHLYTTRVNIRNKITKQEQEISIGELYNKFNKPSFLFKIKKLLYKLI